MSAGDVWRPELLGNEGRRPGPVGSGARQISGHLPEAAEVDVPPLNRALRIVRNTGHGVRHVPFGANSSSRPSPSVVITIGCGQIRIRATPSLRRLPIGQQVGAILDQPVALFLARQRNGLATHRAIRPSRCHVRMNVCDAIVAPLAFADARIADRDEGQVTCRLLRLDAPAFEIFLRESNDYPLLPFSRRCSTCHPLAFRDRGTPACQMVPRLRAAGSRSPKGGAMEKAAIFA